MRILWNATAAFLLASSLVASASANPLHLSPSPRMRSIQHNPSSNCGSLPGGTGILPDGDFSQAPNPGNDTGVGPGTVFAPEWTSAGPKTVDFYGIGSGVPWSEPEGLCSVDLDGTPGPGSIQHATFPTQQGVKYALSFLFSGNGACGPTVKKMEVRVGRVSKRFTWDISNGNSAQNGVWTQETLTFVAVRSMTKLGFVSRDRRAGNCGPVVAGIAVTQSP